MVTTQTHKIHLCDLSEDIPADTRATPGLHPAARDGAHAAAAKFGLIGPEFLDRAAVDLDLENDR